MWILIPQQCHGEVEDTLRFTDTDTKIVVLGGSTCVLGRAPVPTVSYSMGEDRTVSRRHASFRVEILRERDLAAGQRPRLWVQDMSSNGIFRNAEKIHAPMSDPMELEDDDLLRLGTSVSYFRVRWIPFVLLLSSSITDRVTLKRHVQILGARVCPSWSPEVTHMVTAEFQPTPKIFMCLMSAQHIVTPRFLAAIVERSTVVSPLPDEAIYIPPLKSGFRQDLGNDIPLLTAAGSRRTLFQRITFAFVESTGLQTWKSIVELGGAVVVDASGVMEMSPEEVQEQFGHCTFVLPCDNSLPRQKNLVTSLGLCHVADVELTLAMVTNSTSKYCCKTPKQRGLESRKPTKAAECHPGDSSPGNGASRSSSLVEIVDMVVAPRRRLHSDMEQGMPVAPMQGISDVAGPPNFKVFRKQYVKGVFEGDYDVNRQTSAVLSRPCQAPVHVPRISGVHAQQSEEEDSDGSASSESSCNSSSSSSSGSLGATSIFSAHLAARSRAPRRGASHPNRKHK